MVIEGKQYFSSKRASDLSQYTQDYIGQLARSGAIDAHRMGGLWYVSMESLHAYKENPVPPSLASGDKDTDLSRRNTNDVLVSFDGRDYISANRASKITGYNQDYIGQLARGGKILSRQLGKRWYIDRDGIIAHKDEKDALLASVQRDSLGIPLHAGLQDTSPAPSLYYSVDNGSHLLPPLADKIGNKKIDTITTKADLDTSFLEDEENNSHLQHQIPIRLSRPVQVREQSPRPTYRKTKRNPTKGYTRRQHMITITLTSFGIVAILSLSYFSLKSGSVHALTRNIQLQRMASSVAMSNVRDAIDVLASKIEDLIVPELSYSR